jgi:hypothetical protein
MHYRSSISSEASYPIDPHSCLVLILSCGKPHHQHIENLRNIFSAACFQTEHFEAHQNSDLSCGAKHLLALSFARSRHPNSPVLVVEDTSISILDADLMASRVKGVLNHHRKFDLFYLCKWNDSCATYQKVGNTDSSDCLYYTKSPHGLQAVLFTPHGRDVVLGYRRMKNGNHFKGQSNLEPALVEAIGEGNILATTCLTNWINYDLTLAEERSEFARANQCSLSGQNNNNGNETWDIAAWIWLVIIVILVILIAWAIIRMAP